MLRLRDAITRFRTRPSIAAHTPRLSAERFAAVVEERFHRARRHLPTEVPEATLPNAIQAAYAERGELFHTLTIGVDALDRPLTPRTPFRIASQSKPITALLALRMMEAGLIDLDAPIWPALRAWSPTPNQTGAFDHRAITLRHLLSHTAGWNLPRLPSLPVSTLIDGREPPGAPTVLDLLRGQGPMEDQPRMLAPPGERVEYSAIGFAIVQLVLEQAGNAPFEVLVRTHIAAPLGLTTLSAARPRPSDPPAAIGLRSPPGSGPGEDSYFITRAASGTTATAAEVAQLFSIAAACAQGQHPFLTPQSARQLFTPSPVSVEGYSFGLGFALARWEPDDLFKHAGYSDGCCGITEGFVGETCAVSIQSTAAHPGGKMLAQRISGAVLEAVREARAAETAARR